MAKWLMIAGCVMLATGVLLHFFPGLFSWFGRLPGDVRIESGRSRIYFPVVSMLVLSLVLSVIINLFRR
ncbi:DUF2905 domain-containing protein [Microbulbifer thermotolerans]|uniref:DUF2905 domain-containing protein n=1 Tax=Microbulbifer thermotolerans TaxID=252514 RepID=A0A143HL20_MICTH|nr:DUF2905 domain-containing protein [Microbulbifer thermotolerans]AMX02388.1 hypothetical protein A3224_07155 [Microbulbifer thermotolerans]MCX2781839.1 DUF2905 domain-containing protein [Microbulbifer thermotolerans]MCX2795180.1 DUF2905 domain-containing protein [Microbulbifer thermotolerans]MCX2801791.1 DUF2905 domain-containing protein [Microbulbifer thermotolerans]MCX2834404.1 DUF2905 domain-containing protein [Microbulbifer thermotolerans]